MCKCIHIHEGTDAKLTVAGTRRTVPNAQCASSTYRMKEGRKQGDELGGVNPDWGGAKKKTKKLKNINGIGKI